MSFYWTEEDTCLLINWVGRESVNFIKAGMFSEAQILHSGVASYLGLGNMAYSTNDTRYNQWMKHKQSELSCCLRKEARYAEVTERDLIIKTLVLFIKIFESLNLRESVVQYGEEEKIELPEPFEDNSVLW
jgi:hypothetical protein